MEYNFQNIRCEKITLFERVVVKKNTPFKRVESISPLAKAVWENPCVGFLFLVAQLICLALCSALSVLGPQMATKNSINLMKVIRVIKELSTIPETYLAHI